VFLSTGNCHFNSRCLFTQFFIDLSFLFEEKNGYDNRRETTCRGMHEAIQSNACECAKITIRVLISFSDVCEITPGRLLPPFFSIITIITSLE